ncbi:MAG: beta-propeller domain-containing protein [Oscillospiraceae bacterium]|nr:beta-propeller domain-containing protein [Oscillospiraceae bacterium]
MNTQDIKTLNKIKSRFDAALENVDLPADLRAEKLCADKKKPLRLKARVKKSVVMSLAAVIALCVALGVVMHSSGSFFIVPLLPIEETTTAPYTTNGDEYPANFAIDPTTDTTKKSTTNTTATTDTVAPQAILADELMTKFKSRGELTALFQWFSGGASSTSERWHQLREQYGGVFNGKYRPVTHSWGVYAYTTLDETQTVLASEAPGDMVQNAPPDAPASPAPTSPAPAASAPADETRGEVGTTNNQVAGVDEIDYFKNSGKTLFISHTKFSSTRSTLQIRRFALGNNGKMTEITPVTVAVNEDGGKFSEAVVGLFLHDNKLIVVTEGSEHSSYRSSYHITGQRTTIRVYSDMDGAKPKLLHTSSQDGRHLSSRLYNGRVIVATNSWVGFSVDENDEIRPWKLIPEISIDGGKNRALPLDRIYCCVVAPEPSYLVVSTLDLNKKTLSPEHCAVLGAGETLYSTGDTTYIARSVYDYQENDTEDSTTNTEIYRFAVDGTPRFTGSGKVAGHTLSQFSMDEFQGKLRIATTLDERWNYNRSPAQRITKRSNSVYVLNENLQVMGKAENIAPTEEIKSVRFMGNTGYMVTFMQTDPLFVLDLSNPAKPEVTGELKIPGFSTYLHPIADGWLIGVGYPGNAWGETQGVKISLFDVRNPKKPKEADVVEFKGNYGETEYFSDATSDHKAFFSHPDMVGIVLQSRKYTREFVEDYTTNKPEINAVPPMTAIYNHKTTVKLSLRTYGVKNGKLVKKGVFDGDSAADYNGFGDRATYVGDKLYALMNNSIYCFDFDGTRLGAIKL